MTPAQRSTLRALALADPTASAILTAGADQELANWFNTATTFVVWKTNAVVKDIEDQIQWANYTPTDVPGADATMAYANRGIHAQTKQINLQILLQGRDTIDATKASIRAGLQDATSKLYTGVGGAQVGAGWTAVLVQLKRMASRAEAALATGSGTDATPGLLVYEGVLGSWDASVIRSL